MAGTVWLDSVVKSMYLLEAPMEVTAVTAGMS